MTLGPMPCRTCRAPVFYLSDPVVGRRRSGRIVSRGSAAGFKRHNCKDAIVGRESAQRSVTRTPEYRRAYNREWMRRKRAT